MGIEVEFANVLYVDAVNGSRKYDVCRKLEPQISKGNLLDALPDSLTLSHVFPHLTSADKKAFRCASLCKRYEILHVFFIL